MRIDDHVWHTITAALDTFCICSEFLSSFCFLSSLFSLSIHWLLCHVSLLFWDDSANIYLLFKLKCIRCVSSEWKKNTIKKRRKPRYNGKWRKNCNEMRYLCFSFSLSLFIQFWNSDHVPDYFNFKEFSYQHEFDDAD